jgi:hypothetical protein
VKALLRFGIPALLAALVLAAPAAAAVDPTALGAPAPTRLEPLPLEAAPVAPPAMPGMIPTAEPAPTPAPTPEQPAPSADSGFDASAPLVGIIALAAVGLGFLTGSRRHPPARRRTTGPAPSATAAPQRTAPPQRVQRRRPVASAPDPSLPSSGRAIVHSELAPDGYVELEGCLRRVRWAAPGEPPAVGAQVRVEQRGNRLVAHGGRSR